MIFSESTPITNITRGDLSEHAALGRGGAGERAHGELGGLSSKLACVAAPLYAHPPGGPSRRDTLPIIRGAPAMSSPDCHVEDVGPRWSGGYIFSKTVGSLCQLLNGMEKDNFLKC